MTPVEEKLVEEKLISVAARELGGEAPADTIRAVREAVTDHALGEAAGWLVPLLERLIHAAPTAGPVEIPTGYPAGENALANVLLDLASEPWMHIDDYGEGALWRLPRGGVEVFICREHRGNFHTYQVRRIGG